jgi:septal ring factor EnvC (AmiA/AmiB activator)
LNERIAELETERDQAKNELADIRKMVTVSKNYSELWEEREWLSNKLTYAERCIDEGNARIAKIIAERDEVRAIVEKLIKVGNKLGKFTLILDSLSANGFVDDWIALVDEWKESEK